MTIDHIRIWNKALAALVVTTALSTGVVAAENDDAKTRTPIEHLVVIFLENHTFDNYFATYPNAANPQGKPISSPTYPRSTPAAAPICIAASRRHSPA